MKKEQVVLELYESVKENGLIETASLPNLGTGYNSGQGSKTYIKNRGSTFTQRIQTNRRFLHRKPIVCASKSIGLHSAKCHFTD